MGRKGPGFLRILPRLFLFPSPFPICAWMVGWVWQVTSNKLLKSRLSQSRTNEPKNWQRVKRCGKLIDTVILRREELSEGRKQRRPRAREEKWEDADYDL